MDTVLFGKRFNMKGQLKDWRVVPKWSDAIELWRAGCPVIDGLEANLSVGEDCALSYVRRRRLTLRSANRPATLRTQRVLHRAVAPQA